jgi:DNA-binding transcriptional LysR family regulator
MNITTRQLTAFLHAARERSFTRAAERMHISQAGISLMLRELETQVGSRLFERTTRTVSLTPAGAALLPVADRALGELASALGALERIQAPLRNTLRVGATPLLSAAVMPAVFQALRQARPEIAPVLVDAAPDELQKGVASGELDCGLGPFSSNVPGIERSLLFQFDLVYVRAARGGAEPRGRGFPAMRWSELREAPLLQLPAGNPLQQLVAKQLRRHGIRAQSAPLTFNHIETLIGMAAAGAGAAILPSVALAMRRPSALDVSRLVTPSLNVGLFLIVKRGRPAPGTLGAFTEVLVKVLRRALAA